MSGVDHDKAQAPPSPLERVPAPGLDGAAAAPPPVKARAEQLDFFYGAHQALKAISLPFYQNQVTALIGPSGCGKSTLLRCFNRMHDLYHGNRYGGKLTIYPSGRNLVGPEVNPIEMRMRCSMVFQKPNPFPKSIFENVAFSLRLHGIRDQELVRHKVQTALTDAALWEETKDRLHESAYALSGGQQQRLCIARALVSEPEILLFDEPTSALDPVATSRIEDLITALKDRVTIVIVTHNMQQAARVSEYTGFIFLGELIEFSDTARMFQKPSNKLTDQYIRGHFG